MSNLNDISIDKIETDIMSVLYTNMDSTFTQYSLFNKLVSDKYDFSNTNTNSIHPNFKSKFLLIIRNLMSKYDDIKITKDGTTYNIVCLSDKNANTSKFSSPQNSSTENKSNNVELNENDISTMYDYIYDNHLNEFINWADPFDGNSVFHELVLTKNIKQIERLINENQFNYTITNNHNQTPVDLINSPQIARIMTLGLIKNLNLVKENLNKEKDNVNTLVNDFNKKMNMYESNEYKNKIISETGLGEIFLIKTQEYHFTFKVYLVSFIICYFAVKFYYN
jgi:hypothetical protein